VTDRAVIRADGLGKRFGDRWAVRDLSLSVSAGEVFGFLGPNGAGKTTTIRLLGAIIAPTEGRAWINGADLAEATDAIRLRIGLLTEAPGLYERMTAEANLTRHARLQGLSPERRRRRVRECLDLVGLGDRGGDLVATFSKGMKQKLAIARAVLHEPSAIFLDEPTSGLDPEAARDVRDLIRDLRDAGRAIFLCTHNLDEARRLCDRVAIFRTTILRLGTPRDLEREVLGRKLAIRLAEPAERFAAVARSLPSVRDVEVDNGQMLVSLDVADAPMLVSTLVQAGADIQRVSEMESALEAAYLSVVGEQQESDEPVPEGGP
jgi:ABC-2 type transport system ATP-binding protein